MSAAEDIFSVIAAPVDITPIYLNTGLIYDLVCGVVMRGKHNWIVNGGIANILGVGGRSQTYKSTEADSFIAHALTIYTNVRAMIFDSENSKLGVNRYDNFAHQKISDRIFLYDTTTDDLNSFHEKIKDLVEYKKKHIKDLTVEIPILDIDGKPIRFLIPTIVGIDSLTIAGVDSEADSISDNNLDASSLNTIWMKAGKNKTLFVRQLIQYAKAVNMYFVLTAHTGENNDIGGNSYLPPSKQLQYMSQKDKLKGVGAQFIFLTNTFLNTKNVSTLDTADHKECYYPTSTITSPVELNKVNNMVTRNKINISGVTMQFVVSQYEGIMNTLTNLQYLKDTKDKDSELLLQQKGTNMTDALYPDVSFTRRTIREKSQEDYRLRRAIELSAQLIFIKNCWSPATCPVDYSISVEHFVEELHKPSMMLDDILESRGYWTYCPNDRPFLTLFDILDMINTNRVPPKTLHDMAVKVSTDKVKKIAEDASKKIVKDIDKKISETNATQS